MQIEPGTSPKHRYELIKSTLLVIIGALITITVIYGIDYFSPKAEPDPIAVVEPVSQTEPVVEEKSTPTTTPTPEAPKEKVYSQDELNKIFEMDKKKPGTKLFYSDKLGVGFTYAPRKDFPELTPDTVTEIDNIIYLSEKESATPSKLKEGYGLSLEVFTKDPKDTLDQAVTKEFLAGADSKNCFIVSQKDSKIPYAKNGPFVISEIGYPPSEDSAIVGDKCPLKAQPYAQTNAAQFFFAEKKDSSQYGFLGLGQGAFTADSGINGDNVGSWTDTIRFLK